LGDEVESRSRRLERELARLRTSPSLRLGAHITDAMRRPWKAPFLPITLPFMMLKIGLEMLGRLPAPPTPALPRLESTSNHTVVMFPTNGVGFGHFTRMLALAKRMRKEDPELEIVFFTTMPTLHILKEAGFPAHHISGPNQFSGLDSTRWNGLLEEELNLCFDVHKPKMFIFDGAFPYRGMLRAIADCSNMQKVWMRRGTFRQGSSIPVDSIALFDLIVHPEDSVPLPTSEVEHGVDTVTCPPIVLLDEEELLSREAARSRLMLPPDSTAIYIQLGAGEINDINSEVRLTVEALTSKEGVHVVLGESMIGDRLDISLPRVHIIRDYPNSMYFRAFDATVQAGGYNSFHETRSFGLPALFYPNMETGMDDQLARCKVSEVEGWGSVLESRTPEGIAKVCESLLEQSAVSSQTVESGAKQLAQHLCAIILED
jgi:UDP-N-acetylglucosamine--N-acetylmuramyl-(pentapeptide) pyrophosphoryl-undecaprenol N-acetylglucosamine transferase